MKVHEKVMATGGLIVVLGILMIFAAVFGALMGMFSAFKNMEGEGVYEVILSGDGFEQGDNSTLIIESGRYDVWCKRENNPGLVRINLLYGELLFEDSSSNGSSTVITINDKSYEKIGTFEINNTSEINVTSELAGTVYIVVAIESGDFDIMLGKIGRAVFLIFAGLIILGAGFFQMLHHNNPPAYHQGGASGYSVEQFKGYNNNEEISGFGRAAENIPRSDTIISNYNSGHASTNYETQAAGKGKLKCRYCGKKIQNLEEPCRKCGMYQ